jgi:hypothetical protein
MTQELTVVNKQEMFAPTKEDYLEMSVGEPRNMLEVRALANFLSRSKFIPQAFRGDLNTAVMLIVTCKQYGLPITALSEVMEVNGKVGFWGRTKLGIVLKSGVCEYIIPTEQTDKKCTVETQRKGWPKPVSITYTLEQAEKAGLLARSDAWKKHPSDMLYWRAVSRIISQVYPDVIQGFATVEEIEEEQPVQQATAVAMPTPIEEPKPKRQRKVKAAAPVTAEPELMAEETAEEPIMPDPELANAPMPEPVPAIQETPLPQPKPMSRPYYRYIKQVMLEGGVRYLVGINPLNQAEDKLVISSAGLASELKKLTGMQVGLLLENGQIIAYEQLGA